MNTQKQKIFNKKLRHAVAILAVLQTTVGTTNGYAFRHTLIRDTHDLITQTARVRHDRVTAATRGIEDGTIQARRAAVAPGPLAQARWNIKDLLTSCKRNIRDTYVAIKRDVRDGYVSLKREVEDLLP